MDGAALVSSRELKLSRRSKRQTIMGQAAELPSGPGERRPLLSPPVRRLQCTAVPQPRPRPRARALRSTCKNFLRRRC